MPTISITSFDELEEYEVFALYNSVGWAAYTNSPTTLRLALRNSACIVTARDDGGELIGLARAISDNATICYVQDILVHPDFQRHGIGRSLMATLLERFDGVRQTVLITDDEPGQRKFYEAMGLTEGADTTPNPLRMFAKFR